MTDPLRILICALCLIGIVQVLANRDFRKAMWYVLTHNKPE